MIRYLSAILALLLVLPHALAIQASPASFTHEAEEGPTSYTLTVTNDETRPLAITLTPNGPLAQYLEHERSFTLEPGTSRAVQVRLTIPEALQPGTLESGILVESRVSTGSTVGASAAVMHVVRLVTPYEGAYIDGELLSSAGIAGEEALITLAITNTGSEAYTANPVVYIDGRAVQLEQVPLAPGETKAAVVPWTPRAIGQYEATAGVTYANKQASFATTITVGELDVEFTSTSYGDFLLGEPFRVSVGALNRWGADLPVELTVDLLQNNTRLSTARQRLEIPPLREERYTVFLETAGAQPGTATIRYTLVFAGRERTLTEDVIIGVDSIVRVGTGTAGPLGAIIAILLILILAGAAIYTLAQRRRRRK